MADEEAGTAQAETGTEAQPHQDNQPPADQDGGSGQEAVDKSGGEKTTEVAPPPLPEGIASREEWLDALIQKGKDTPGTEYTDEELDLLDEYYAGKIKPKTRATKPDTEEDQGEKSDDGSPKEGKAPGDEDKDIVPSSIDLQLMKEVGAKTKSEILDKIKGLRKAISGKLELAPEFVQMKKDHAILTQRMQNEIALWDDFRKGVPEAVAFVKKNYIPNLDAEAKASSESQKGNRESKSGDRLTVDPSEMIDEKGAELINKVLQQQYDKIEKLQEKLDSLITEADKGRQEIVKKSVENTIIDEMVQVAESIPHLKGVKNIREAIVKWRNGVDDPRMEYFNDLFEIANSKKVDLVTASAIDRGMKADLHIEKAKTDAKKEVYARKPNRSLSEVQGKQGEFHQYSDAEIEDMVYGKRPMPDDWFDEKDQPRRDRIPKRAHKYFWAN